MSAMPAEEKLTLEAFALHMKRAVARHNVGGGGHGGITARVLAHKAKCSTEEVEAWLDGKWFPPPPVFARVVWVLPTLRYLKPALIVAYNEQEAARLALAPAVSAPAEPKRSSDHFGEALAALRVGDGLTQSDVSELLKVSDQAVSHWELSRNVPILEHYDMLVDLWPALTLFERPAVRDIEKPVGRAGNDAASVALAAPPAAPPAAPATPAPTKLRQQSHVAWPHEWPPPVHQPPKKEPVVMPPAPPQKPAPSPQKPVPPSPSPPLTIVPPPAPASSTVAAPANLLPWLKLLPLFAQGALTVEEVLEIMDLAQADGVPPGAVATMIRQVRR